MWSNKDTCESSGFLPGRAVLGPLFLVVVPPMAIVLLLMTNIHFHGSFLETAQHFMNSKDPMYLTMYKMWPSVLDPTAWALFGSFCVFELAMMRLMPGKRSEGPVTPAGNIPVYKANGELSFYTTTVVFLALLLTGTIPLGLVYDKLPQLLAVQIAFSMTLCGVLYLKGRCMPSSSDCGSSGNIIFDYYWGTELYPRIFGWDVKQFSNCRFGMMLWVILPIAYAAKQYELTGTVTDAMVVSVLLQFIYVAKFFHWEMGYMRSIDIMHDRGGYYLVFGCMAFLPGLYTTHTCYLVRHPVQLGWPVAALVFLAGVACIFINYDADRQREYFRKHPTAPVWGKAPQYITANYVTEDKQQKTSLLLLSGYWGLSRHFHYLPELGAAFCWSVPPALFTGHALPWSYFLFLTLLLVDRAYRDEARCLSKYGADWLKYVERVPHRIVPGLF